MAQTIHDKLCVRLEWLGATRLPKKNKYTMYRWEGNKQWSGRVLFIGKAGAFRQIRGNSLAAAKSVPCSDRFRAFVLETKPTLAGLGI